MVFFFRRSELMVKEETPTSYLLDCTPSSRLSNAPGFHLVFTPSFAATASNRSTSQPTTSVPLRYSFGL